MAIEALADCAQFRQAAEVSQVVGDGTYLSTGEAARLIGISQSHLIRLINDGKIPATKAGTHRRILRTVAEAYRDQKLREAGGQ
jgi:excisionase family DNA binding protein